MRLTELNPKWEPQGGYTVLAFDCPKCGGKGDSRLAIPVPPHPRAWNFSTTGAINPSLTEADFDRLTVTPSIDFKHGDWGASDPAAVKCNAHFFITDGEIKLV